MLRSPVLLKLLAFTFFVLVRLGLLNAQTVKDYTYPLYSRAALLDTNRGIYSNNKITQQIDSTWKKGKLIERSTAHYASNGNITEMRMYYGGVADTQEVTQYKYNTANVCISTRFIRVVNGDTVYVLDKKSIRMDTARGIYAYETKTSFITGKPDTAYSDFEWDYIDTQCKRTWSRLYMNHTYTNVVQRPGSDSMFWTVYNLHDNDTLEKRVVIMGPKMYTIDSTFFYLSPGLMARAVFVNNRSTETRAWQDGKLIEYYTYDDSVSKYRVWKSTIYNKLKSDSIPEIVITMSDSINIVCKNGVHVFEDYTPDTVHYDPLPPPPPPPFSFETWFPYRKAIPIDGGLTRLEYYNFRAGTAKPLFVIIRDDRGVIHNYSYQDYLVKRIVQ